MDIKTPTRLSDFTGISRLVLEEIVKAHEASIEIVGEDGLECISIDGLFQFKDIFDPKAGCYSSRYALAQDLIYLYELQLAIPKDLANMKGNAILNSFLYKRSMEQEEKIRQLSEKLDKVMGELEQLKAIKNQGIINLDIQYDTIIWCYIQNQKSNFVRKNDFRFCTHMFKNITGNGRPSISFSCGRTMVSPIFSRRHFRFYNIGLCFVHSLCRKHKKKESYHRWCK